ncbi:MAG: biotin transporter BioY [Ruminococcaceae bacterium]|nr:biotin transporter BioY [Oscillospiraceae bacterium]
MIKEENGKTRVYKLAVCALMCAMICVLSVLAFPVFAIPITFSVFAVLLVGALLTPKYALFCTLGYILLGAVGLPVFSGFNGGLGVLFGPTGGYIMAYPFMALAVSITVKLFKKRSVLSLTVGMLAALVFCYLFGTVWFSHFKEMSFVNSLLVCVVPYVVFDLIKLALAVLAVMRTMKTPIKDKLI